MSAGPLDVQLVREPSRRPSPWGRVLAGAVLVLGGLALIGLGGCFQIGILLLLRPDFISHQLPPTDWSSEAWFLLVTLNVMTGVCLLGALVVLVLGVRALLRVAEETANAL